MSTETNITSIIDLKNKYTYFDARLQQLEIEHKMAIFALCEKVPSIILHLDKLLNDLKFSELKKTWVWMNITKKEFELLSMLALPAESDEFIFAKGEDLVEKPKFVLYDSKGNPI